MQRPDSQNRNTNSGSGVDTKTVVWAVIGIAFVAGLACAGYQGYKRRWFHRLADRSFWEETPLYTAWHRPVEKKISMAQKCLGKLSSRFKEAA